MVQYTLTPALLFLLSLARLEAISPQVCLTEACITQTGELLEQMDRTVDPCQDFYQFSCGGYIQNTVLPDHKTDTGPDSSVEILLS